MTTILYLIRHGETDWNRLGRWQGHTDVPLNARGLRQAELLAQRLKDERIQFDAIYSSDLARAYQTAWEIGAALKVAVQLLPPLREIDLGNWSGLTREEIRQHYPVEFRLLEDGRDIPRGGGETAAALYKRATEAVEAIVAQHPGERLALVAHGGTVRSLLRYASQSHHGMPLNHHDHIGNSSISILHCDANRWEIVSYNDMHHLQDLQVELVSAPPDDAEQPLE